MGPHNSRFRTAFRSHTEGSVARTAAPAAPRSAQVIPAGDGPDSHHPLTTRAYSSLCTPAVGIEAASRRSRPHVWSN